MEPIREIPTTPPQRDYLRPEDRSWSPFPLILGVVFAFLLAYLFFGNTFTAPTPDRPVTSQRETLPTPSPTRPTVPTPAPTPQ